ncbi:hypothetical protein [Pedobacter duraquae]|uniref:Glycosyltransferase involved in cell wall biosynthesis n=1 Tax=Pedobacter duraquae TaxID=425511 RepID=A0A4V3C3B2_9SPHI|nr:hypothetical protein [Pedobacter duraquae]TDO21419.1 hypothetical protein CLV32_2524 [Pedobacter duraquae]
MINIVQSAKIYVLCPAEIATGGPEALHQLTHHLIKQGFDAYMYYVPNDVPNPVNPQYEIYKAPYTTHLENQEKNVVVMPETFLPPLYQKEFSRMQKVIWWLSVPYYFECLEPWKARISKKKFYGIKSFLSPSKYPPLPTLGRISKMPVYNIRHSFFSESFLKENHVPIAGKISDYMNQSFFDKFKPDTKRENQVLYNPKKNGEFLNQIMDASPDINWVAVENLSPTGVAELMNTSKVYVDFGFHPGKERMPREACIMKCCMIIGKDGSAKYAEDMPIPELYRFEKDQNKIPEIINLIRNCLSNYDEHIKAFEPYQQELAEEETTFKADIAALFLKTQ